MLLLSKTQVIRNKIMLILWQSWNLRNNAIHSDAKETVAGSVQYLLCLYSEPMSDAYSPSGEGNKNKISLFPNGPGRPMIPTPSLWSAPISGTAKLNFDASFIRETGDAWGSAVDRDHKEIFCQLVGGYPDAVQWKKREEPLL